MATQDSRFGAHLYPNILARDSAYIHAGDVNQFHGVANLTPEQQCCQAFKTSTYEEYKDRNPPRIDGTCQWVLTHPQYQKWRQNKQHDLLWVSADPGCGKSVLAKALVDRDLYDDSEPLVCYFFFKDNEEQDNVAMALCAILHQVLSKQPALIRHALEAWKKNGDRIQKEIKEMWHILRLIAADPTSPPILCVLDALDECRELDRRQLITLLCEFLQPATSLGATKAFKFLVTSRPYDNVQRWFEQSVSRWPHIRLRGEEKNEQIQQEIILVIDHYVQEIRLEFGLSHDSSERLRSTLMQMQHRTYLWLYLAIEDIRNTYYNSLDPDTAVIDVLPRSVEEAYERLLQRINRQGRPQARQILLIIVGARRPLTVGEMSCALGVVQAERDQSRHLRLPPVSHLEKRIRDWCGLFVFIQHSTLYLIHQTAKEFLLSNDANASTCHNSWQQSLNSRQVELEMLKICTLYLHLAPSYSHGDESDLHVVGRTSEKSPIISDHINFFRYCSEFWAGHLQADIGPADGLLFDRIVVLYDDMSDLFAAWFSHFRRASKLWYAPKKNLPSQHAIALNGQCSVLAQCHQEYSFDLNLPDRDGRTALYWAASYGHLEVSQWLLKMGANVNARGYDDVSALQIASEFGHTKIVWTLLDNGADGHDTALLNASTEGHAQIVRILLERGAKNYNTPLLYASASGHTQIVRMLVERGATDYDAALLEASEQGQSQIVEIMLDNGADEYNAALLTASEEGYAEIVQILLNRGADDYNGALIFASREGHTEIVQMLLDKGADDFDVPLDRATLRGHALIVQMLTDRGASSHKPHSHAYDQMQERYIRIVRMFEHKKASLYGDIVSDDEDEWPYMNAPPQKRLPSPD